MDNKAVLEDILDNNSEALVDVSKGNKDGGCEVVERVTEPTDLTVSMDRFFADLWDWEKWDKGFWAPLEIFTKDLGSVSPRVNLREDENNFVLEVESLPPGINKDNLMVDVSGRHVTLSGEVNEDTKDENDRVTNRSYKSFRHDYLLSQAVDSSSVSSEMVNGVLTITLPRVSLPGSRRAEIQDK